MDAYQSSAQMLKVLAHPARLRLLNALCEGEECVCHLTALLHQRQSFVSQQLMFLRRADVLIERKEGARVYYRIKDPRVLRVLDAIKLDCRLLAVPRTIPACPCPKCGTRKRVKH